jgi:hypothetical protein
MCSRSCLCVLTHDDAQGGGEAGADSKSRQIAPLPRRGEEPPPPGEAPLREGRGPSRGAGPLARGGAPREGEPAGPGVEPRRRAALL